MYVGACTVDVYDLLIILRRCKAKDKKRSALLAGNFNVNTSHVHQDEQSQAQQLQHTSTLSDFRPATSSIDKARIQLSRAASDIDTRRRIRPTFEPAALRNHEGFYSDGATPVSI